MSKKFTVLIMVIYMLQPSVSSGFNFNIKDMVEGVGEAISKPPPETTNTKPQQGNKNVPGKLAVQGCLAGGVGAAFLSNIMGKSASTNRRAAAFGCLAGGIVGYQVGKRTQKYANENQALQRETARNRQLTKGIQATNRKLTVSITDYKQQVATIRRSQFSQQEKKQYLLKTKNILNRQINSSKKILNDLNSDIVIARKNMNKYSKKSSPQNRKMWQNTVIRLERERSVLNRNVHQLVAIGNSI